MSEVIADDQVVLIHYTLRDPKGEVLDSSEGGPPLAYLHGAHNLVPGLESAMTGRAVGESFEVVVAAADGYGERDQETFQIPRGQFPPDAELHPGVDFVMEDEAGDHHPLWVVAADAETVTVDPNHPLAGMELRFAIEVVGIRAATEDELDHGHPHGPGGHH